MRFLVLATLMLAGLVLFAACGESSDGADSGAAPAATATAAATSAPLTIDSLADRVCSGLKDALAMAEADRPAAVLAVFERSEKDIESNNFDDEAFAGAVIAQCSDVFLTAAQLASEAG